MRASIKGPATPVSRMLSGAACAAFLAGCGGGDVSPNSGEIRLVNAKGRVIATVVRTVKTNKRVAVIDAVCEDRAAIERLAQRKHVPGPRRVAQPLARVSRQGPRH